jgi:hypothetical protein
VVVAVEASEEAEEVAVLETALIKNKLAISNILKRIRPPSEKMHACEYMPHPSYSC